MKNDLCDRNIRLLNVYTLLTNMVFILPVLLSFYREEIGLNFHDFLITESVFAATLILFDVPAGYLADRWGRKYAMALGALIVGLGFGLLSLADSFFWALIVEMILGIGIATISGSNSALLYDSLLSANRVHEYRKREGFRFALQLYGVTIASIAGGYLYTIDHTLPLIASTILFSCGAVMALMMVEPERHKPIADKHPLRDMRDTIIYVLHGHRQIAAIALLMIVVFSTTKLSMWCVQAYAGELNIPEVYNGWIIASVMLIGALSGQFGHHVFKEWKGERLLFAMIFYLAFIILMAGIMENMMGLLFLATYAFVYGFGMPRAQEAINKLVDSSHRATVLSTANLCTSLGFIPLSQAIGFVSKESSLFDGLIFYAFILIILAIFVALINNKRRPEKRA